MHFGAIKAQLCCEKDRSGREAAVNDSCRRDLIARTILENGPSTAVGLGERLGLSPAGIRRHLDTLVANGALQTSQPRAFQTRGRGRPSKVFIMTDDGREKFEHTYDDLAVAALKFLGAQTGDRSLDGFATARAKDLEVSLLVVMKDVINLSDKAEALAIGLSTEGYAGSVQHLEHGEEIHQHHCPIAHVAAEFPQLCEAETEAFSRLLGTHVQRLATIAHGDGVCTTYVPHLKHLSSKANQ